MTEHWEHDALCAQVGGDFWFPERGASAEDALRVCRLCPVQAPCLELGLQVATELGYHHGVFGGKTAPERKAMAEPHERKRRVSPVVEQIQRLAKAGMNDTQIAAEVHLEPGAVAARRHRNGIPAGQPVGGGSR